MNPQEPTKAEKLRKRILLGALALIAVLYAGDWLLSGTFEGPLKSRRAKLARYQDRIEKIEGKIAAALKAGKQMAEWESQSLPSDLEEARSLYQAWLLALVNHVGLEDHKVSSNDPVGRGAYRSLAFSVRGRGTLAQLTQFLYEFYRARHLHLIRSLTISPLQGGAAFDVSLSIEAISLPTADRRARLAAGRSDRLAFDSLGDYSLIVNRNLFAVGGGLDATNHTYLTSINAVDGRDEAWFHVRTTDSLLRLRENDALVLADARMCKLRAVDEAVLTTGTVQPPGRSGQVRILQPDGSVAEIGTLDEIERGELLVETAGGYWRPVLGASGESLDLVPFDGSITPIGRLTEITGVDAVLEPEPGERWLLTLGESLADATALPPER